MRKGYRCREGCTCGLHYKSPETRARMSDASRDRKHTPEAKAKIGAASRGRRHSAETRAKISTISRNASPETREKMSIAGRARAPVTIETRERLRSAVRKHIETCDDTCGSPACAPRWGPTRIENTLVEVLLAEFPEVQREARFGRYRVDAYIPPPYHIAFEADGRYWHNLPGAVERDAARDAWLLAEHGLPVVRLTEKDLSKM